VKASRSLAKPLPGHGCFRLCQALIQDFNRSHNAPTINDETVSDCFVHPDYHCWHSFCPSYADPHADTYATADAYSYTNGDAYADSDANSDSNVYAGRVRSALCKSGNLRGR